MTSKRRRGAGGAATLVFFASTTSTSDTITLPTGILDGDLGVLVDAASNRSADPDPALVTPSGYTNRADSLYNVVTRTRLAIHTKPLSPSDSGAVITGMNAVRTDRKAYLVFRRAPTFSTLSASTLVKQESDANPSAATADYSGVSGTSITLGVVSTYGETGALTGQTFSPTPDGSVNVSSDLEVYYLITETVGPSSPSVDQGDGGSNNQNFLINFRLT